MKPLDLHNTWLAGRPGRCLETLRRQLKTIPNSEPEFLAMAGIAVKLFDEAGLPHLATEVLRGGSEVAQRLSDYRRIPYDYASTFHSAWIGKDRDTVGRYLSRAVERRFRRSPNEDECGVQIAILWRLACIRQSQGSASTARRLLDQAHSLARDLGDPSMIGTVMAARGWVHLKQEQWSRARACFLQGLYQVDYSRRDGPKLLHADLILGLSLTDVQQSYFASRGPLEVGQALLKVKKVLSGTRLSQPLYTDLPRRIGPNEVVEMAVAKSTPLRFQGKRRIPKDVRTLMNALPDKTCAHCGTSMNLVRDHVIHYSWGGMSTAVNLRWLCDKCNRFRGDYFVKDDDAYVRLVSEAW